MLSTQSNLMISSDLFILLPQQMALPMATVKKMAKLHRNNRRLEYKGEWQQKNNLSNGKNK